MTANTRLGDYATLPLYNIKAVVKATGITPSTLRAWERRYDMCQPQRTESGYRLYSERDLAVIRWLKAQVAAGMTISQAVAWMDSIVEQAGGQEQAVLPNAGPGADPSETEISVETERASVHARDFVALQRDLLVALVEFNELRAEAVLSEAFSMYTVEEVGERVVMPLLVDIGERWHRGELSTTTEHFATNFLMRRLSALLRTVSAGDGSAPIWVGCAPGELHEVGAMLLTIYLRRAGYAVHYLGQNLVADDVASDAARKRPAMILISASSDESATTLTQMTARLAELESHQPLIGYGGRIFAARPELRGDVTGVYMGATAEEAVAVVGELLRNGARSAGAARP